MHVITGLGVCSMPLTAAAAPLQLLVSGPSQRCLDIYMGSQEPATPAIIFDCHGRINQLWEYTAAGELRTFDGARCLDVRAASTLPQAIVQSYPCHGRANQQWIIKPDNTIVSAQSGLCLTVLGGRTANGAGIDMWPCRGLAHQQWSFSAAPPSSNDTQPPTPPGGLAISGLTCRAATLSWNAATDNVGVAYYDIYRDGQALGTVNASTLTARLTLMPGASWGLYETNLIVKGGNYGWPNCEGVISRAGTGCATAGYVAPKMTYRNTEASCSGIAIVGHALYVGCLAGKRLYRSEISGASLVNARQFFVGVYGRIRTVEPTIDGNLWLTTSDAAGDKDSVPNNTNTQVLKITLKP